MLNEHASIGKRVQTKDTDFRRTVQIQVFSENRFCTVGFFTSVPQTSVFLAN